MRKAVLAAAVLCLAALPLFATQANPSKKQREIIEELLRVTNMEKVERDTIDAVLKQVHEKFLAEADQENRTALEEATKDFERFREILRASDVHSKMREVYVDLYAKYFTEKELEEMVAFYKSDLGRKSLSVLPQLMAESMQRSEEAIGPLFTAALEQVAEERDKRKPWVKTMANLTTLATALEAYATDTNEYPNTSLGGLKELLEPVYIKTLPMKDSWGNDFAYIASADGKYYRFVSAGADGIFEWDSRRIVLEERQLRYKENLKDDIIYADGEFVQLPAVSKENQ